MKDVNLSWRIIYLSFGKKLSFNFQGFFYTSE